MSRHGESRSFTGDLVALWPGLPYLGFGLLASWIVLSYSGVFWLSDNEVDGRYVSERFIIATSVFVTLLLLTPVLPKRIKQLFDNKAFIYIGASIVSIGSLLIVLAGPYYLDVKWMFYFGCVLTGLGLPVLVFRCGRIYSGLRPIKVIVYIVISQFLVVGIYFSLLGTSWYYPVVGGPPLSGTIGLTALPICAAMLINLPTATFYNTEKDVGTSETSIKRLPVNFWKMCVAVFAFAFVSAVVRGYNARFGSIDSALINSNVLMILRLIFAILFLLLMIRAVQKINFGKLYLALMIAIALSITLGSSLQLYGGGFGIFINFCMDIFDIFLWCLLALIAYQGRISHLVVFGFGRGIFTLGALLGWMSGAWLVPQLISASWAPFFFVSLTAVVLVCAILVFSEREFEQLFHSTLNSELTKDNLVSHMYVRIEQHDLGNSSDIAAYLAACKLLADRFGLTEREQDIFDLLALGRGSEIISLQLHISLNTVRTHTQNIYTKAGLHSRNELMLLVESVKEKEVRGTTRQTDLQRGGEVEQAS